MWSEVGAGAEFWWLWFNNVGDLVFGEVIMGTLGCAWVLLAVLSEGLLLSFLLL